MQFMAIFRICTPGKLQKTQNLQLFPGFSAKLYKNLLR